MIICDGRGKVVQMWGGYSPKVFDGEFISLQRQWLETHLKGAGVVADQHFEAGKNVRGVKFFTKMRKNDSSDESEASDSDSDSSVEISQDLRDLRLHTKKEKSYNKVLYKLRARVEIPFGEMRTIFEILNKHWRESKNALDEFMWVVVGVLNARK